jgi:succinate dehydrogenase / fumarate reductase iron-sulfur subunit
MGNMPIIKDLIVDMDAVHWKKVQRVTPWLINKEPIPEREYVVPRESMIDVTQSMACIQCGACVSDCLSMEVDPLFIGPAALAKAYRFVGDPRDAEQYDRLKDLAEDPHGIYDCTHCFKCIEACPKGVAPMSQIMRLRRRAGDDHAINDRNNGHRHEKSFVSLIRDNGLLWEAELLPRSYGGDSWFGKFAPKAGLELVDSLPVITKALLRRKVTPAGALKPHRIPKGDLQQVERIYERVESRPQRYELNLYITGYDEDLETSPGAATPGGAGAGAGDGAQNYPGAGEPGMTPEESPTR